MRALLCARSCRARRVVAVAVDGRGGAAGRRRRAPGEPAVALGTPLAAELYGGVVLRDGRRGRPGNVTRFVWLAPGGDAAAGRGAGARRASSWWGGGRRVARAGSCAACREFAFRGVNLTRIESRPLRLGLGHYMFFADLDGAGDDAAVAEAIEGAATRRRRSVKVLGAYPRAADLPRNGADTAGSRGLHCAPAPMSTTVPAPLGSVPLRDHQRHGPDPAAPAGPVVGCWCSTRRSSRSTSARCAARPCCCSRRRPRCSSAARPTLHWATGALPRPHVIRLVTYVRVPRDPHRRKITRRAVFARDDWTCQYCGARTTLTVDHVIPRSKGGAVDVGQHRRLLRAVQPPQGRPPARTRSTCTRAPSRGCPNPHVFIQLASPTIPATWKPYLQAAEPAA